jgi:dinuclear metal center YbgI/SA1388 family protein
MVLVAEIFKYLDELLVPEEFDDITYNGVQVQGKEKVEKIVFTVDSSLEIFEKTALINADLIITHHGLIWGSINKITDSIYNHLRVLIKNDIGLYCSHLPLDKHNVVGNNIGISKLLGLTYEDDFNEYGIIGNLKKSEAIKDIKQKLVDVLHTNVMSMEFGKMNVQRIAVCSGSSRPLVIDEAVLKGVDCIILGEGSSNSLFYYPAKEKKQNILFAGHYATEKVGIQALMKKVQERFHSLECVFLDFPTGF